MQVSKLVTWEWQHHVLCQVEVPVSSPGFSLKWLREDVSHWNRAQLRTPAQKPELAFSEVSCPMTDISSHAK